MATLTQVATFLSSVYDLYTRAGGKLVSKEVLDYRFSQCKICEHFNGKGCSLCGCCTNRKKTLFNKLAYPTETCPADPPKWTSIE